jgi:hypothetical protein
MKLTRHLRLLALVLTLGGGASTTSYAQERPVKAHVDVRLLTTNRTGATGSVSSLAGSDLAVGQTGTIGVYANFFGSRSAGGWPIGVGGDGYAWKVEARLISVQVDTVEVAINWGRYRPLTGIEARETGDYRVISLRTNERHVLDLVQSDKPDSPGANLVLQIEARQVEDPAYANVSIGYDLWLVYEDRAGARTTRRTPLTGGQGESRPFAFRPLGFALDGNVVTADSKAPINLSVEGALLGRLRPDGAFELVVDGMLRLGCGDESSVGGGGGQKRYVAGDGETVSVELPFGSGHWGAVTGATIPPNARPGVSALGQGGIRVTKQEFFQGDRLSLLATARRTK